ncbi:PAS domain-containing hybrid sensor histidine kinase/response regulator [Pyxidicoccus xibeiensis]|uniref:PAS domain-containing hybrid sensor histidine kinase/response regulator n=1 Tax=Pyxidicoccus xibeiensis TaxID=2906759 RepID=UPI0020A7112F|nr:ATP-binding protein [Pyxidicoccus xibeiensis]MCP3138088.1 ATP-binding protein [Pyxidicoccus xibeiensis]
MKEPPRATSQAPEDLLEESAEDLYENAPCGYISTRPDGLIVKANQTFLTWLGYTREELLSGRRFQDLLSVGGRIFHETHFAPLLLMQGFLNEVQLELLTRAGTPLPVLLNTVQRRDAAGRPLLNRTTLFNISDRKKYERELVLARRKAEQAARAKADFLSMVSHEIRTPMNAIIGISSLLQRTELSPQQQKYVRILESSSENLLGLINHILDFSKIDSGKAALEERPFNLRQLVYGTIFALNIKAEEKQLPVIAEIDDAVPEWLVGDPVKLAQVLTNLVSNAIKFTELGAVTVTVGVREAFQGGVAVDFAVTDTGIGIAEERLDQIFEEFTQADYDIGLKYGGTGLGLAISRKLVELHGGRLGVKSTPGQGSSFSFTLRLKLGQEVPSAGGAAEGRVSTEALQGLRILVAEDNAINVFMLSQFLQKWGANFDVVGDGQQAVERIQTADYDLVLMDVRMPELDGYAATLAIRALPGADYRRIPIIAVTASTRLGLEHRASAAGFTDFIGKPYKPSELAAMLVKHSAWRQAVAAPAAPPAPSVASPAFSLRRLRRMLDDDPKALVELSSITLASCEQYKDDFQQALETGNRDAFVYQSHKIRPTLELLQAHSLRAAVKEGLACFPEAPSPGPPARVAAAVQALHRELDAIIAALREELRTA